MTRTMPRAQHLVSCIFIVATTFLVYEEVRLNGFVWDTVPFVVANPWLHHPGWADIRAMFLSHYRANWQPLVWVSHAIDFAVFDDHPGLHHLANVAFHAANGCLVFRLTWRLAENASLDQRRQFAVAFIAALLFAVHPQHVQSVAWLVERKDTLYVLFTLLCLISYVGVHRDRREGIARYAPFAWLVLALMSKPMAVTVPVVLVLLDLYPLDRWRGGLRDFAGLVVEKWPYWLASACVIFITLHTQQGAMIDTGNLPVWARPLTAMNNYLFYFRCYLLPLNLSPIYPYVSDAATVLAPSYWLPGASFLLVSFSGATWLFVRGTRWPLVMVAFYVVTLLPVCGLIAVGPAKALDYYSYLATLPFGICIGLGLVEAFDAAGKARSLVVAVGVTYLVALAMLSFAQVRVWRNEFTVWDSAWSRFPDSPYINRNLAAAYFALGDYDRALELARKSAASSEAGRRYFEQMSEAVSEMRRK